MRRKAAMLALFLLTVESTLALIRPVPAHASGGGDVLGHLYAGTSDPAVVYRYVGGTDWEALSPTPHDEFTGLAPYQPHRVDGPAMGKVSGPGTGLAAPAIEKVSAATSAQTPLGKAVLDLIQYEGHLYAGTVSWSGTGQVWRHDGRRVWTLVGDALDDRVSSLQTYQGHLYAATGRCGNKVYKYTPRDTAGSTTDWTLQADRAGRPSGLNDDHVQHLAAETCIRDYVEQQGDVYLATDEAIMYRSSIRWEPVMTLDDEHVHELELLDGLLYTGYSSGELRVTDGVDWPGELVFTAHQAIRSMTTDQRALFVGTGDETDHESTQSSRAGGKVYRLDDANGAPEPVSGVLGASIEALYAVGPSGLDLSKLERGDILLVRGPGPVEGIIGFVATWLGGSYWIHGGMYAGEETVVESSSAVADDFGMVRITGITETLFWEEENYWAAIRVKQQDARDAATSYAESQEGDLYNIDYPFWGLPVRLICEVLGPIFGFDPAVCCPHRATDRDTEDDCFYCTHLPWRAYDTQGIDLDSNAAWPASRFAPQAIPGDDLYYDEDVILVDQRKGMQAVIISAVGSPADMLVIDPEGRRTGVDPTTGEVLDEIPDVTYGRFDPPSILDFLLPDEWQSEFIAIPDLDDTWEIRVTGTKAGDYTLGAELVDWQLHHTQTITATTQKQKTDVFKATYPERAGELIIRSSKVYLPLVTRAH